MTCATLRTLVHEYLDGELPPRQRALFEARLAACAHCRASVAAERAVLEHVRALMRNPPAPHWLGARISAALAAQGTEHREGGPGTVWH